MQRRIARLLKGVRSNEPLLILKHTFRILAFSHCWSKTITVLKLLFHHGNVFPSNANYGRSGCIFKQYCAASAHGIAMIHQVSNLLKILVSLKMKVINHFESSKLKVEIFFSEKTNLKTHLLQFFNFTSEMSDVKIPFNFHFLYQVFIMFTECCN